MKTRGEIAPIFRDLPSPYAAHTTSVASARPDERYRTTAMRPFRRGVPAPLLVVLAVLIAATVLTHLPFLVIGFVVFWFVVLRHRRPWHHRGQARHPGWR